MKFSGLGLFARAASRVFSSVFGKRETGPRRLPLALLLATIAAMAAASPAAASSPVLTPNLADPNDSTPLFQGAPGQSDYIMHTYVFNNGLGTSSGTYTLTWHMPSGVTVTAISGSGFSCTLNATTPTCSSSQALGAFSGGPSVVLTMSIDPNITSSGPVTVNPTVDVSGGGNSSTISDTSHTFQITANRPSFSTAFSPTSIAPGATSTLTYTVSNSAGNFINLHNISTSSSFPSGLVIAPTPNLTNSCGGTATATAGAGSLTFSGVTLAPGTNCTISASVTAASGGAYAYAPVATSTETASRTAASKTLTVVAPPTVISISPTAGPTAGGTSVVITGTNLTAATAVTFGATAATSFTVNSATQITATSPAGAAGTSDITVTTGNGTSATGAADQFTWVPAPTVTSISPTSGPATGGTTVTITGTGFSTATAVTFGATPATGYTLNSNTQITATAPAGTGTVDVRVTGVGGTSATSAADHYTYIAAPVVTSVSPTAGPTAGGTTVTITGTGFLFSTAVTFGATPATSYSVISSTQITAVSPANAGTVDIRVTTSGGTSATSAADQFTYVAQPTLSLVTPRSGPSSGGTTLFLTGTGFTAASTVSFGGTPASSVTVGSATSIIATAPAGSGTVDVRVATEGGTSATFAGDTFTFYPVPTITSISPASGSTAGGTSVTITGTNLSSTSAVSFGGTGATYAINSDTSVTATAPAGTGTVDLRVTTIGGTSATSAADQFTYVTGPAVTSISPSSGPAAGGTSVTITGTGFTGATAVKFGAIAATSFTVNSATQITATSPANAGTLDVRVTTPGGTSATSPADQFTFVAQPSVTSISPTAGPTSGGTTVTITGANLLSATAVTFGATPATSYTVNSATSITATAPAGAGTVDLRVTTTGGTSSTSAADQYTYVAAPSVTSISPSAGPSAGGATVTITGTNFAGATAVTFGATPAASFTVNSNTQITATSPAGVGTVDLRVTSVGGTSATSGVDQYTYITAPAINGLSPATGPTSGGTTVVITGTNLTGATSVVFGINSAGSFTVNSSTQITAVAPAGGSGVHVKVTTAGGTSPSVAADVYTYVAAPTVTSLSPSSGPSFGGTTVTLTGTGFSGATAVTFGATPAASFTVNSATSITATAPAGTGTVDVRVTSVGGTSATGAGDQYTFVQAPAVTGVSPASGPNAGGNSVTITGANLSGATAVTFGASPAAGFTVNSSTSITATAPAGSTGTVDLRVTTVGGTSATGAADQYTYVPITLTPSSPLTAAKVGVAYSATISASGGSGTYTYARTAGALPAGLTLSAAGALSGTPTQGGSFSFTITATDTSNSATGSQAYALTVNAATITVAPTSLAAMTQGVATSQAISASGGTATYRFSLGAGTLPAGLSLAADGTLSGTPGGSGAYSFSVVATDSSTGTGPYQGFRTYSGTIAPGIPTAGPKSATTAYGTAVDIDLAGVITGVTPTGVTVATAPGHGVATVTGTTTIRYVPSGYAGVDSFTYTATGPGGTSQPATVSITVAAPVIDVAPRNLASATVATAYSASVTASGGAAPYSYAVTSGALPAGLTLASNGTVSGTPTAGGDFVFTVTATDSSTGTGAPFNASKSISLTVRAATVTLNPASLPNGAANAAYSQTLTASGGTAPYSYALTSGALPAGLTLAADGQLIGTPSAGATSSFSVTATDSSTGSGPYTATRAYSVTITGAPTVTINPAGLNPATAGKLFSQMLNSTGGAGPYHYAITAGALPAGMTLSTNGQLSGTPATAGTFNITVTSTDSSAAPGPYAGSHAYVLTVASPAIIVNPATLANGTVGVAYTQAFTATGGQAPYAYAVTAGTLPAGLTLSATGQLTGKPTQAGSFPLTVTATDHSAGAFSGNDSFTLVIAAPTLAMTTTLPNATAQTSYAQTLTASGGTAPYGFTVTAGTLPDGLTLTPAGLLSGQATTVGAYAFTITATDSSTGASAPFQVSQAFSFNVNPKPVTVTTATIPSGKVGVAYSQTIAAAGGVGPYAFDISAGALPAGLALASDGTLSGTPTAAGSFSFTVRATDSLSATATHAYSLTIAAPTLTVAGPAAQPTAYSGVGYSTTLTGSGGTAPYSFTLATGSTLPDGFTLTSAGVLSGMPGKPSSSSFSVTVTDSSGAPGPYHANRALSLQIVAAPAPTASAASSSTHVNTPVTIDLTASVVAANTVAVSTAPAHGSTTVSGLAVTYTPATGFSGTDSFSYTATGPAGTSAPAVVSVTVGGAGPASVSSTQFVIVTAQNFTATTPALTPVTVDVTAGGTGGPFTGATVVSVSPSTSGTAVAAPTGASGHYAITFTPNAQFSGTSVVTFTLTSASGTSAPATLTVTVQPRPDPSLDPDVKGVLGAQSGAARRFTDTQIGNFGRRMEQLHGGSGADGQGGYASRSSFGLSLGFGDYASDQRMGDNPASRQRAEEMYNPAFREGSAVRSVRHADTGPARGGAGAADLYAAPGSGSGRETSGDGTSVWVTGSIDLGQRHLTPGQAGLKFETSGLSFGVDRPFGEHVVLGVGGGWGHTTDRIGTLGTTSRAGSWTGALYASFNPASNLYLDAMVGRSSFSFDTHRHTAGSFVTGSRDGAQTFASLTAAWEHRSDGGLHMAPYGRIDAADGWLGAFTETGDPVWALAYGEQKLKTLTGSLGLHGDYAFRHRWGSFTPSWRFEYRHEFEDLSATSLRYADLPAGTVFQATPEGSKRDNLSLGAGGEWGFRDGWRLGLEWEGLVTDSSNPSNRYLFKAHKTF